MAIINKTGIGEGNLIEAEHVTRAIDALSGGSSDSIIATGSFTGSFKGDGSQLTGVPTGIATTASYVTSSGVNGPLGMNSILSASFAVTASYLTGTIDSASFASTASFVPNAILQNGNSFDTTMIIGPDDAYNLSLQASGSVFLRIEGSTASVRGHVRLAKTGSIANPALTFNNGTSTGIGYALEDGFNAISISNLSKECVSFDADGSGASTSPIALFGDRRYFKADDKWGQPGIHVQNGGVSAESFFCNIFYSTAGSDWRKSSLKCENNILKKNYLSYFLLMNLMLILLVVQV
jgi:hypothetical protein